jgi:hypothetical protein
MTDPRSAERKSALGRNDGDGERVEMKIELEGAAN